MFGGVIMKKTEAARKTDLSAVFIIAFLIVFGVCFAAMLVMALLTRGDSYLQTLFYADNSTNRDFFMDFFNSLRDSKNANVFRRGSVNTPLACAIFYLFSHMIPKNVTETTFSQRYAMQANQQAIVIYYVFIAICLVSFAFLMRAYLKGAKNKTLATVLSFMFLFFYPLFYCVERGNIVLLSMICTAFFVFFHDSEDKRIRVLSLIVFAFGAALKLYPVVFLLLLVKEKRYKDLLKALIAFLVFFFAPAVFYHYGADIVYYFKNIFEYGQTHKQGFSLTSVSLSSLVSLLTGNQALAEVAAHITGLLAAVAVFLVPKDWQRYALLAYIVVNMRVVSSVYVLIFFLVPFLAFLSARTEKRKIDWLYLVLFCLLLLPLPCLWYFKPEAMESLFNAMHVAPMLNANLLVAAPAVQLMFLFLFLEGLLRLIEHVRDGGSPLYFFGGPKKRNRKTPTEPKGKNDVTVSVSEGA